MTEAKARQNFSKELEAGINAQINRELYASYVYLSIAAWCDRDGVSLKGLEKYCELSSLEERGHARLFIDYLNQRGGRVTFTDIHKPAADDWKNALHVMESILDLEKSVNQALLDLHENEGANDPQFLDFLEGTFLVDQVEEIKDVADKITRLKRAGCDGLGLYLWDRELLEEMEREEAGPNSDSDSD